MNFNQTVSLSDAAKLIQACGQTITFLLEGEPGIGKTAMLAQLAEALPNYETVYVDAPLMDIPDIALPWVDKEANTTHYAPSELWKFSTDKPLIIMLDELGKAAGPTKLVLTRLLLERTLGDIPLPAGSIVFATGNQTLDGVGDHFPAHLNNRITRLRVRKPDADEWAIWAMNNNVAPLTIAWVKHFPHCLAAYSDSTQIDNPYIFNPKKNFGAFVSPRSLAMSSYIVKQRARLGDEVAVSALEGCVGAAAARDQAAFFSLTDVLPTWEAIEAHPDTVAVPDSVAARMILLYGSVQRLTTETFEAHLKYIKRMQPELQAVWAKSVVSMVGKIDIAIGSKAFATWAVSMAVVL